MARRGKAAVAVAVQAAVAVQRPGNGKRCQGMIRAAAHRPRIRPRMILAEQLRKTNGFGIQVGAQTIIGVGINIGGIAERVVGGERQ